MNGSIALAIWAAFAVVVIALNVWVVRRGPGFVRALIRDAVLDALEQDRLRQQRENGRGSA